MNNWVQWQGITPSSSGWVAWSNLESSRVRGKCLFNSIKGQFIMCILPRKQCQCGPIAFALFPDNSGSSKGHWFISEQAQVNLISTGSEPRKTTHSGLMSARGGLWVFGVVLLASLIESSFPETVFLNHLVTKSLAGWKGWKNICLEIENLVLCPGPVNSFLGDLGR